MTDTKRVIYIIGMVYHLMSALAEVLVAVCTEATLRIYRI